MLAGVGPPWEREVMPEGGKGRTFIIDEAGEILFPACCIAVNRGTGCVGRVIDVVLGDVEGIAILGGADFGSSSTCLVVLISPCGIGCVGNCTSGMDAGDDGERDTLETTCGLVRVDAGKGWRIVLTTAAAEDEA